MSPWSLMTIEGRNDASTLPAGAYHSTGSGRGATHAARTGRCAQRNYHRAGAGRARYTQSAPDADAAGVDATAAVFDALVRIDADGRRSARPGPHWHHSSTRAPGPSASTHARAGRTASPSPPATWPLPSAWCATRASAPSRRAASTTSPRSRSAEAPLPLRSPAASYAPVPGHRWHDADPARARARRALARRDTRLAPFNRHPIGSGPFTVGAVWRNGRVVEEANADYFGGAPRLARLVFGAGRLARRRALDAARRDEADAAAAIARH